MTVSLSPQDAVEAASELLKRLLATDHNGVTFGRWFRRAELWSTARLRDLCDPDKHAEFAQLVEDARGGNRPDLDAELCEWGALAVFCAGGIPLPLREYVANKFFEQAEAGRRARGQHPDALLVRNFAIMYAVARVGEHGFHPTRNPTQDSIDSASSIVTKATILTAMRQCMESSVLEVRMQQLEDAVAAQSNIVPFRKRG
jgi:hypothetical protein